jgi:hypothetical protein
MKRKTPPQISPGLFKKLLDNDSIDRGTKIYLPLDQSEVHWQHKVFTILGIDNDKKVLLVLDANKNPHAIPFDELGAYYVLINNVESKYSYVKKTRKRKRYAKS